jgi:hypothetical protein
MAQAHDLHAFLDLCAARQDAFFLVAVFYPDLAIETIAVPAKIAEGDGFHREKLETAEQSVVFGNHSARAFDLDFDEPFERLENVLVIFKIHRCYFRLSAVFSRAPRAGVFLSARA